ncbi:class I SAM-dependent methyltransferase [Roseomonas rosulenta]|uniref:class I SAM-dependent methyltransferase n=1 Tax=Roseomonas rosulenta TaxID=2748667 RepID=UPI0018E049AA|nr:class I SAM-dependent methyltransferase [Roseomonas rosulenta]
MTSDAKSLYGAADVRYVAAYQPEASPARMQVALAIADTAWRPLDRERLTVLDIGCGRGVTACLLAAANPGWDVIGLDLQPVHIAEAREVAAEAGLANARFIEADVTELDEDRATRVLPEIDVVICYGVWTWVPDNVRDGIVRLLRHRLKPGGIAFFGYNAMPAWGDTLLLQRVLDEAARGVVGSETARANAALDVLEKLRDAGARYLPTKTVLDQIIAKGRKAPAYMVHEWLTSFWRPAYHADLAKALVGARMEYGGCARPATSMPALQLDDAQQAMLAEAPAGFDRETLNDMFLARRFRTDIFVRGRQAGGWRMLPEIRLALAAAPDEVKLEIPTAQGEATLPDAQVAALVGALAEGPKRIGDLARLPECADLSPLDLAVMLVESGVANPVWRDAPDDAATKQRLLACNKALLRHFGTEATAISAPLGAAVPMLGTALPLSASDLSVVTALQDGVPPDPARIAAHLMGPDEGPQEMARAEEGIARVMRRHMPAWRAMGLV